MSFKIIPAYITAYNSEHIMDNKLKSPVNIFLPA